MHHLGPFKHAKVTVQSKSSSLVDHLDLSLNPMNEELRKRGEQIEMLRRPSTPPSINRYIRILDFPCHFLNVPLWPARQSPQSIPKDHELCVHFFLEQLRHFESRCRNSLTVHQDAPYYWSLQSMFTAVREPKSQNSEMAPFN